MTAQAPDARRRRNLQKQNLLLASRLARGQALGAFGELAGRADAAALRVARVRVWLSDPMVWAVGGVVAAVALTAAPRRVRRLRLMRWGLLAWRVWRIAAPALTRWRSIA